jgi:hypothetical protein
MAFTSETIRLPRMDQFAEELAEFCRSLEACLAPGQDATVRSREMHKLRELACSYRDRPSLSELKYMVLCNLVLDFAAHDWTVKTENREIYLRSKPVSGNDSPEAAKDQTRAKHLIERDAQLLEPSVRDFVLAAERRRLTSKGWHSIYSVMRSGEELALRLRDTLSTPDGDHRAEQLAQTIDPYLQFVTPDAVCAETGLQLNTIWRYFRHTWVNIYRSVPGRSIMVLVRDRGTAGHPVIGIAALGSSVVQQSVRDKWIGWDTQGAAATLCALPRRKLLKWLSKQLRTHIAAIYKKDLLSDRVLTTEDLTNPSDELIARLRRESARAIELHRKYPQAAAHKRNSSATGVGDWITMARTPLFRSKRCKQLAILLSARKAINESRISRLKGKQFRTTLASSKIQHAISQLVRIVKAERVGISMMDIIVCGAVAPYNALLGGKLVCVLLCSPEVVQYYAGRYRRQVSVIASAMRGKKVHRDPKLILLCTTSLYGKGSSQYNRIKIPAASLGGFSSQAIGYQELGTSEGFGSFHFSKETVRLTDALLGRSKNGRKVNSIFGEGVNPLMRKMREVLDLLDLPSELLLRHGNKRIVYGIPLAENFRPLLLGLEERPRYIIPQSKTGLGTSLLSKYWRNRWLVKRCALPEVLQKVAANRLTYPIQHGAQVPLPNENENSMFARAAG